jgi:type II secretory pathway component PulM
MKALLRDIDLPHLLSVHKKRLAIFISILIFVILLVLFAKPYSEIGQTPITLRIAQSNHLKNLIFESKPLNDDGQLIVTFDDRALDQFKKILIGKGMMVSHLSMNAKPDATIEIHLKNISFASFIDVLNESRDIWHIYPMDVSVEATDSAGIVHVKATLMQFRANQSPSSVSQN